MTKTKKITIVAQGGGMTAAYHAGVIAALKEKYDISRIEKVVATSGAAAIFTYFVSDQIEYIKPMYEQLVKSHKFVDPRHHLTGRGMLNIDYMVDHLIKDQFPLNLSNLKASPIEFMVGVTDAVTGRSKYFSKDSKVNFYELLRASCAVPYFGREEVTLKGRKYLDGTISSVTGLEQAENDENIIVILTRPNRPLRNMFLVRHLMSLILLRKRPPMLQQAIWDMIPHYQSIPKEIKKAKKRSNVVVIRPSKNLPMHRIDERLDRLDKTIQRGYQDAMDSRELAELFSVKLAAQSARPLYRWRPAKPASH